MSKSREDLVSVIIPFYNNYKYFQKCISSVKSQTYKNIEIIIINDGSTDKTKTLINENKGLFDKAHHLKNNQGKGKAIIEGLKIANQNYVFIQDADLEYNPNDLIDFVKTVDDSKANLVMGSRFIAEKRSVLHFWHMLGNKFITFLFNILNHTTFTDIYCCYILFVKENLPINKLKSHGWGQQAEILTYLSKNSNLIYEIGVNYNARKYNEGKKIRYFNIFSRIIINSNFINQIRIF
jgi:glycosyltransferase involved in cell wall biosynthesis